MKFLKLYENYNRQVGESWKEDGWRFHKMEQEDLKWYLKRFYSDKKWLTKEGDFDVYYWDHIERDEKEDEDFWHKKVAIYVNEKEGLVKTKEIFSKPLFNIRDKENGMTSDQEIMVRSWAGTDKNPKGGKYLGMENGVALVRSPHSGNTIRFNAEGKHLEEDGSLSFED